MIFRAFVIAVVCHVITASPLSLRLFLTPRDGVEKMEAMESMQRPIQIPIAQDRMGEEMPSPIETIRHPILFTAQARMNVAASPRMMMMAASPLMDAIHQHQEQAFQQPEQQLEQQNSGNMMVSQRRMDADEELLEQMPYSPQRRMDMDMGDDGPTPITNGAALPFVPLQFPFMPNAERALEMGLGSQPIPVLLQVPIAAASAQARVDEDQPQLQQIAPMPHLPQVQNIQKPQQEPVAIPVQLPFMPEMPSFPPAINLESLQQRTPIAPAISFRAFPIVHSPPAEDVEMIQDSADPLDLDNDDSPLDRFDEIQTPEPQQPQQLPQQLDGSSPSSSPLAVKTEQQRIMVFRSAARLRPVIVDSLETVMQFFNAVAPDPSTEKPEPIPQVNITARADSGKVSAEELTRNLDKSIEAMTVQVADVLSMLTAQAKKILPLILKSGRNSSGIVEPHQTRSGIVEPPENKSETAEVRHDPVVNEIKPTEHTISAPELGMAAKNLTETITRYVQLNSDEFRRTWKHFLHNYWNYVQKILENMQ